MHLAPKFIFVLILFKQFNLVHNDEIVQNHFYKNGNLQRKFLDIN